MLRPRILRPKPLAKKRPVNRILEKSGSDILESIERYIKTEPVEPDLSPVKTEVLIKKEEHTSDDEIENLNMIKTNSEKFQYFHFESTENPDEDFEDAKPNLTKMEATLQAYYLKTINHDHQYAEAPSLLPIIWQKCEHCLFKAKTVYGLQIHILREHNKAPFDTFWMSCELCEFRTEKVAKLNSHMARDHGQNDKFEKWYECVQCNYKTKRRYDFSLHLYNKHTSPENLVWAQCPECPYKGKTMRVLKGHMMRQHKGQFDLFFN